MSFFRNLRSSITRGKSSSRDTTPVRTSSVASSSRPASIISEGHRDSICGDSVLNRGETFILGENSSDLDEHKSHSNSSTLEKKSKKSKVLSKFSTFTKRKKTPQRDGSNGSVAGDSDNGGSIGGTSFEHHPSDNATNTYYKWNSDGSGSNIDYDAQTDPFNFLYEQHSNLKMLQNGRDSSTDGGRGAGQTKNHHSPFDSSTYRKGKASTQLKAQLEQLKTQHNATPGLCEEDQDVDQELESDKYKTVTLSSFRKSFRDKYLQQQKETNHNPAWFVEVEPPSAEQMKCEAKSQESKENRPEYLVFENENYRPGSRSPVRDRSSGGGGGGGGGERKSRSTTRSPVKRNETFRIERPSTGGGVDNYNKSPSPSIRVEIKNSVMPPNITSRIVPVGVAKPMPALNSNPSAYRQQTATPITRNKTSISPQRGLYKSPPPPINMAAMKNSGRYQTLVQISNDNREPNTKFISSLSSMPNNRLSRATSTRIQLGGYNTAGDYGDSNTFNSSKYLNNIGSRYSYAAPEPTRILNYEPLKQQQQQQQRQQPTSHFAYNNKLNSRLKHTYFGGDLKTTKATSLSLSSSPTRTPTRLVMSSMNQNYPTITAATPRTTFTSNATTNVGPNKFRHLTHSPKRSPSSMVFVNGGNNGGVISTTQPSAAAAAAAALVTSTTTSATGSTSTFVNRRDLHQPRYIVPVQRRSRSPIKIPWR